MLARGLVKSNQALGSIPSRRKVEALSPIYGYLSLTLPALCSLLNSTRNPDRATPTLTKHYLTLIKTGTCSLEQKEHIQYKYDHNLQLIVERGKRCLLLG